MTIKATLDADGKVTAFFVGPRASNVPPPEAVEVSEADYRAYLDDQKTKGFDAQGNLISATRTPTQDDIDQTAIHAANLKRKEILEALIDGDNAAATSLRAEFNTMRDNLSPTARAKVPW